MEEFHQHLYSLAGWVRCAANEVGQVVDHVPHLHSQHTHCYKLNRGTLGLQNPLQWSDHYLPSKGCSCWSEGFQANSKHSSIVENYKTGNLLRASSPNHFSTPHLKVRILFCSSMFNSLNAAIGCVMLTIHQHAQSADYQENEGETDWREKTKPIYDIICS